MKTILHLLFWIVLISLPRCSHDSELQWMQTIGPCGGPIRTLSESDDYLFAGTEADGVFFSRNNGSIWAPVNSGWPSNVSVSTITTMGLIVFAGTFNNGILRSTRSSPHWEAVNRGLPDNRTVSSIVSNGNTLYAGIYQDGIFQSTDTAKTWRFLKKASVTSLAALGTTIIAGTNSDVLLSQDSGKNWISVRCPPVLKLKAVNKTIFAGTNDGVHISRDTGKIWIPMNSGIAGLWVEQITVIGTNIFAGINAVNNSKVGIYRSADDGNTWMPVNIGLTAPAITSLASIGTSIFASDARDGVFRSIDTGSSWSAVNSGLPTTWNASVASMTAAGARIYAGTDKGVFISENSGMNWNAFNSGIKPQTAILSFVVQGNSIFAGTDSNGIYQSSVTGMEWSSANVGIPMETPIQSLALWGNCILAGTKYRGVFKSMDNGNTWSTFNDGLQNLTINCFAVKDSIIFAGADKGEIYQSKDVSTGWLLFSKITVKGPGDQEGVPVQSLLMDEADFFAGLSGYGGIMYWGGGMYRSTDNGFSWAAVGAKDQHVYSFLKVRKSILSVAVYLHNPTPDNYSINISKDRGATWTGFVSGLPNPNMGLYSLIAFDSYLFVGGNRGIWRRQFSDLSSRGSQPFIQND
ncbi:MAG: hypothetical protein JW795_24065 [Chitinivibrionales bacterium]|nr:hypothetical protein [Chitinivibrionales bacterium]